MGISSCPFGTSGFECSFVVYLIPAMLVLGALLFRKNIANDLLAFPFSVIGGSVGGVLIYFVVYASFHVFKYSVLGGILGILVGGFALSNFLGDGETE